MLIMLIMASRYFGPKIFRHHQTCAEVSGQLGTRAKVSRGLSRPPANIIGTIGHTEERKEYR